VELEALWNTLKRAEVALRQMDTAGIAEVVAFSPEQQKNWDVMAPVFARSQSLNRAAFDRFGAEGASLTSIKTFGERIDEILPQVDETSCQWELGESKAGLHFGYRDGRVAGGTIFFVKVDGGWKIDAGQSLDVSLEGLHGGATRLAMRELDDGERALVVQKMESLQNGLLKVAKRIEGEQNYDLKQAQAELQSADTQVPGRAFFHIELRFNDNVQARN
jgi:hypothetical protein